MSLTSHQIGETHHCKADNVSLGAGLARTTGATREEAESKTIARAKELLGRTQTSRSLSFIWPRMNADQSELRSAFIYGRFLKQQL